MNCPLCQTPGGVVVFQDEMLRVVEVQDAELPGSLRVIWNAHAAELTDLSPAEQSHCWATVARVERTLRERLVPDKVNLASFGNQVPHLHWHIMARWKTDPWWPQPTWGSRKPIQSWELDGPQIGLLGDWAGLRAWAEPIRQEVFVEEQGVSAEEEWDLADRYCRHVVVYDASQADPQPAALATGRLLPNGRIGRMAVRRSHRARGLGSWVLQRLMQEAQTLGLAEVRLHAQLHALAFYERHGFVAEGPEFRECEIPHRTMRRGLADL